jgi:hypothetical protein
MAEGLVRGEGFATDASIIKADAQRQRGIPGDEPNDWVGPGGTTRPVREYLEALETAEVPDNPPKAVSLTDPSSSWTAAHCPGVFAYCTNYLIDLDAGIIMDVEASTVNSAAEAKATRLMIDRVEEKYDIKPARLVGDTNYGSSPMLEWMVNDKGIEPQVPVKDQSERKDGTLSRGDFIVQCNPLLHLFDFSFYFFCPLRIELCFIGGKLAEQSQKLSRVYKFLVRNFLEHFHGKLVVG